MTIRFYKQGDHMKRVLFVLSLVVILSSCSDDSAVGPTAEFVQTTVDLQLYFGGHRVIVWIDSLRYFDANLKSGAYLAGPDATFITYLLRSEHRMIVAMIDTTVFVDTLHFSLGSAQRYFIGLQTGDTISMRIQDHPFYYD